MNSTYRLTRKRRGEIAEAAFLHKAAQLGFTVSKTWGDSDHYDFIIDSGARSWRIQIKSAHTPSRDGYRFRASGFARDQVYTAKDIDFLIAYIAPEDSWYILPIQLFGRIKSVKIITHSKKGIYRFGQYREAWCQLTCPKHGECWKEIRVSRRCDLQGCPTVCDLHSPPCHSEPLQR